MPDNALPAAGSAAAGRYDTGLDKCAANHVPLTPLTFLDRTAAVYPDRTAVIYGDLRRSWRDTRARVRRLADALARRGIGRGDTVAAMLANTPEMYEASFGIPLCGAVINTLNTRLDAPALAYCLRHGGARALLTDGEFAGVIAEALALVDHDILVIDVVDAQSEASRSGRRLGPVTYEELLAEGDPGRPWSGPADEWDAIALNYTSGTTGDPKGVVYHHRGAYLNAVGNALAWNMTAHPVYLWTLPMFHCNGWCFPWSLAAFAGTNICMRKVTAAAIFDLIEEHRVDHFCGAPTIMNFLINAQPSEQRRFAHTVRMLTAAAPPPAAMLEAMERMGFEVSHVYGLTETYGPSVVCSWHEEWDALPLERRAELKARQGVRYHMQEEVTVLDPTTLAPIPADGATVGEVMFRGNLVMKGYLADPAATEKAFRGGWFHSGDLAVLHPDGYIELKDRSKDIIISGGENISSIEVEGVLYRHPAVLAAAVVAKPDETWGETPCAFVELKPECEAVTEREIVEFCRKNLAHFKCPRTVIFGELPKTSTGKIQKFKLRERIAP